jgi:hypothetical protein
MIARVASFEGVDVEEAQRTMAEAEAVIRPLVERLDGYRGQLTLVAGDGRVHTITFFESEEDAAAAEPTFDEELPKALGHIFAGWAGHRVSVGHFFVAADERA